MVDHRRRLRRPAGRAPGCARPASSDIRIIEKGGDFGGTWYWNRYPGRDVRHRVATSTCRCSRRSATCPKEKYAHAPEILEHSRSASASTSTSTTTPASRPRSPSCAGTRRRTRWIVTTNRGDAMRARFVVHGQRAAAPAEAAGHPGHRDFKGHTFHTSRWDYDYTGGDSDGGLDRPGRTSASASSAPAPPRSSASRTSARRPSSSTSSSARRRRSTCATTARPTRSGRRRSSRAGSSGGWTTSTPSSPAASHDGGPRQRRLDRHHRQAAR